MINIEIKGTGNHNKGAEMMLLTILEQLGQKNVIFSYAPLAQKGEYPFYSNLGLYPKIWYRYKGVQLGKLGNFVPKKIRDMYGLVIDNEVEAILDASGFAYSDQWGEIPAKNMANESRRWKKAGKKIILLPQAFGPFEGKNIKKYMKEIIANSDLVFARDEFSYGELTKLSESEKIKLSPDFTTLFEGQLPAYFDKNKHQVCIVPNKRVIDKGRDSSGYLDLIVKIINKLNSHDVKSFFLIYGGSEDCDLAVKINAKLINEIEIIDEANPAYLKGIIKESIGLIGSRYHSIASALYSGTIAVGIGWSHKYKYLFNGLNFNDGLIDLDIDDQSLDEVLSYIVDPEKRLRQGKLMLEELKSQKYDSLKMFDEVRSFLEL